MPALRALARGRAPGQVVIQFTDRCNAACVQCGMRVSNRFERTTMRVDAVRNLLDAMAARGIMAVSFTGGEPLLHVDDVAACMRHAGQAGIRHIRTGTNGFMFKGAHRADFADRVHRLAETLAATPLSTFWISIDSADPETHEQNRGLPGVVRGIEKALPILARHGIHPSANLGLNRLMGGRGAIPMPGQACDASVFQDACERALDRFYAFVRELGFTIANCCYPMSHDGDAPDGDAIYAATSSNAFIRFSPTERAALYRALSAVVPRHRHRLRVFTPRSALLALARDLENPGRPVSRPCRGGKDFFFIDAATMHAFPCGYRGAEDLGPFEALDTASLPEPDCRRCDWECFRDPSELFGPISDFFGSPIRLSARLLRDRIYAGTWFEDMRYYRACDYFNARVPPDLDRLARFRA
ncbi:MAG: radical SAM protein [Desulfovibrionaceae bacterium]